MTDVQTGTVTTKVPARLDRLPWSRWHWMVVIGLGTVWILDGLEVTIVGNISGQSCKPAAASHHPGPDRLDSGAAIYVAGACVGRPGLRLAHRPVRPQEAVHGHPGRVPGRPRSLTAFSSPPGVLPVPLPDRMGIGGEYAAINSAIDELIPAGSAGTVDLVINGSYWLGAAAGALLTMVLLTNDLPVNVGWRSASAWAWSSAWSSCSCGATCRKARAGCSSTAGTRRPRNWWTDRGAGGAGHRQPAGRAASRSPSRSRQRKTIGFVDHAPDHVHRLPAAHDPGLLPVHRPGVPLQRDHCSATRRS